MLGTEASLKPCQTYMIKLFWKNSQRLFSCNLFLQQTLIIDV